MKKLGILVLSAVVMFCSTGWSDVKKQQEVSDVVLSEGASAMGAQVNVTYPLEGLDDTLAMNNIAEFKSYAGQGKISVVSNGAKHFDLFVNGIEVDCSSMKGKEFTIDISSLTRNDVNTVQVTNIKPTGASVTIKIDYPTVIEGKPEDVGMSSEKLDFIDTLINKEVEYGFPGGQLAIIKDGSLIKNTAYGYVNAYQPNGELMKRRVKSNVDTLYDLASNTKMYATNYAIQKLASEGKLSISDTVSKYFPEFKDNENDKIKGKDTMTLQNILEHQAGFPADPQYHNDTYDLDDGLKNGVNDLYSVDKETTKEMILKTPLQYEPGSKTIYSDVDYMLLGMVVEKVVGMDLDTYVEENIYKPLGLDHIVFNPLEKGFNKNQCAASELNGNSRDGAISFTVNRKGTIQGEVHDEKAYYAMNGVSGHAGLFASAQDLARLAQVMLNEGGYGNVKLFDKQTIDQFTKPKFTNQTYGLGWRRIGDGGYGFYYGPQASASSYGHTGWTGTLSVIDSENDMIIIWLSNKINSPVVDPNTNPNYFFGNHFLGGTLGGIATLSYDALNQTSMASTDSMLLQMVENKMTLIETDEGYQNEGDTQSLYALIDVALTRAEATKDKALAESVSDFVEDVENTKVKEKFEQLLNKVK